ncbi:uncharacterized protein BDR25DRAFT_354441 [Lindgomyces ingoldianus]|uniref:Uncharacterized protein n=1 Tax=Lindgomyces ingoldianus TaxID=673940 RepID=A0ACB6QWI8_9PLEO|nr:uncharacterized protein BDR25DRAFT_354441 [Lindgomyces ingoldianus]KAF2471182.1 hypothetical protein BDR25DRAFT_354441 [Lindgomyces ingoldianus]
MLSNRSLLGTEYRVQYAAKKGGPRKRGIITRDAILNLELLVASKKLQEKLQNSSKPLRIGSTALQTTSEHQYQLSKTRGNPSLNFGQFPKSGFSLTSVGNPRPFARGINDSEGEQASKEKVSIAVLIFARLERYEGSWPLPRRLIGRGIFASAIGLLEEFRRCNWPLTLSPLRSKTSKEDSDGLLLAFNLHETVGTSLSSEIFPLQPSRPSLIMSLTLLSPMPARPNSWMGYQSTPPSAYTIGLSCVEWISNEQISDQWSCTSSTIALLDILDLTESFSIRYFIELGLKFTSRHVWFVFSVLLTGTKCPHPRPNSGHQYSHVDSAKSYSAQPQPNTLTFAPPQLTLAHGLLKLNQGCSSSNLAASGCLCFAPFSVPVLILHLQSYSLKIYLEPPFVHLLLSFLQRINHYYTERLTVNQKAGFPILGPPRAQMMKAVFSESHGPAPFITKALIVKPLPNYQVDNCIAMVVVLTTRDQELLARSSTTITAIDQSKVKNKTIEDDSSKPSIGSVSSCSVFMFKLSHPTASIEYVKDLEDFMLFVGAVSQNDKEHMTKAKPKFCGDFYYGVFSVYAWRRSPIVHVKPRVRFIQHRITTTNFESAGRIGEFAKSDRRDDGEAEDEAEQSTFKNSINSEFQDAYMFTMFSMQSRKTELYIRLTKDEKGKGANPQDRQRFFIRRRHHVCPLYEVPIIHCIKTVKMFGSLGNHTFWGVIYTEMTVI